LLRGEVKDLGKLVGEAKTNEWLQVHEIKQKTSSAFETVDPVHSWMPFQIQSYVLEEVVEASAPAPAPQAGESVFDAVTAAPAPTAD
jgi:hypothetical protein